MKTRTKIALAGLVLAAAAGAGAYHQGLLTAPLARLHAPTEMPAPKTAATATSAIAPAITVAKATRAALRETVLVTGSLVAREEIMVAPEVEGLRVIDLKADIGDRVKRGDVLAELEREQLEAQLAQNTAALARAEATIAQARSMIEQAEAAVAEAEAQFERAKPLRSSGYLSESVYDQRAAAARTTAAQLVSARDGLKLAEASKQEAEARGREISWRLANTQVKAPRDGIVSRRTARIGALATGVGEPMFRIIAGGEIELEASVIESDLARIAPEQPATIDVAGASDVTGHVRLISPEVDRATRLGTVKVLIGDRPDLRIGAFARAQIATREASGITVPSASLIYGPQSQPSVLLVRGDVVERREVKTGLRSGDMVEIVAGLAEGDLVVAKSGTFLREGDHVRPMTPDTKISEAR
ncbi:MAG: efflux RND transporter periplasmic adaptor subunit [Hyphomicrobiaceae bacterium]|nr:efflux RND transporter periplasmic adaptor subunit [Hyphomicrobiaceae bacterium]MCC0007261.1 efflux RND transporter periplasmic adaptor subunit [Hyphomicrobiaceae bacterium]